MVSHIYLVRVNCGQMHCTCVGCLMREAWGNVSISFIKHGEPGLEWWTVQNRCSEELQVDNKIEAIWKWLFVFISRTLGCMRKIKTSNGLSYNSVHKRSYWNFLLRMVLNMPIPLFVQNHFSYAVFAHLLDVLPCFTFRLEKTNYIAEEVVKGDLLGVCYSFCILKIIFFHSRMTTQWSQWLMQSCQTRRQQAVNCVCLCNATYRRT